MRLTELEPRWISPNVLGFLCPHCKQVVLTCKNIVLAEREQHHLFEHVFGDEWNMIVVGCKAEMAWSFSGTDFNTLTIAPSIDASNSGHWHGTITNGEALP